MTREKLNELSIFALRELARRTGVKSPTSRKKDELIQLILDINEGKLNPQVNKTKQGRPPKEFSYEFVDVFKSNNMPNSLYGEIRFNQHCESFTDADIKTVSGYVDLVDEKTAYLWALTDYEFVPYFLSAEVLLNCNVKNGDKIIAEVISQKDVKLVKNIFNINGTLIKDFDNKRKDYNSIESCAPNKKIKNVELKDEILFGENVYFYGANNTQNTSNLIKLINGADGDIKIYLNVSVVDRNIYHLKEIVGADLFTSKLLSDRETTKKAVMLAIEYAKRCLELGKNVILAVDDLLSISAIDDENLTLLKNLVSLAKSTKKDGNITLFAICQNNPSLNIIEKLADKKINF